jgi:hypothetical protein
VHVLTSYSILVQSVVSAETMNASRFNLRKTSEGKPAIEMEMFHNTVPHLAAVTLSFEVLSGITIEQTRDLVEKKISEI